MKESRKGKFDAKGDEEIFLGYSFKSKAYRCLNLSTHKVIESAHVKVDEFVEKIEEERKKELEDYRRFVYIELNTFPDTSVNKETSSTKPNIVIELQEVQTKSQGPELQTKATESIAIEPEQLEPKVEPQEANNTSHSKGKKPMLAKYVRRHHTPD